MQMGETKPLTIARASQVLHRLSSDTEEQQRDRRVILVVPCQKTYKHPSARLLTTSVSTTGVTPRPQSPPLIGSQLRARSLKILPGGCLLQHPPDPWENSHPHSTRLQNCTLSTLPRSFFTRPFQAATSACSLQVHPGGSSHQYSLPPPNLKGKPYQKLSSCATETTSADQMLVSPSRRQPPLF